LENLMTRACVLGGGVLRASEFQPWLLGAAPRCAPEPVGAGAGLSVHEMERKLIEATLERFGGHRGKTAQALGIGVRTLANKLRSYGYGPRDKSFARAA
jgi:DNA-binding NtrC family response regulator